MTAALPASSSTGASTQVVDVPPIPFRSVPAASAPEIAGILITTLLVLTVVSALAWVAQRRGWLERWTGLMTKPVHAKRKLMVLESLRISPRTMLYRMRNGDDEFVVFESSANVQMTRAQRTPEMNA